MSDWQFKGIEKAKFQEPLLLSLIMFISYLSGSIIDYFAHIRNYRAYFYPNGFYLLLDILTILFIFFVVKARTRQGMLCKKYLLLGLSINSILFLIVQIDFILIYEGLRDREPWWFWYVFPIAINTIDALMVSVLLFHRNLIQVAYKKLSLLLDRV